MPNLNLVHSSPRDRYEYDLSHTFTFSTRIGRLVPVNIISCIPGDTIKNDYQLFARLAPLVNPIMTRCKATFHSFFVPFRLIFPQTYKKVLAPSAHDLANQSLNEFCKLTFTYGDLFAVNVNDNTISVQNSAKYFVEILDYIGLPISTWKQDLQLNPSKLNYTHSISFAPILAFMRIYVDYFIDSLKMDSYSNDLEHLTDLADNSATLSYISIKNYFTKPFRPTYNRDYFNTSQYEAQLGNPVDIAMNIVADTATASSSVSGSPEQQLYYLQRQSNPPSGVLKSSSANITLTGNTTNFTINDLKELFARQKWADIGNQFGQRYIEQVLGHFGVQSSDARLGRPDYVGSKQIPFEISEIANMTADVPTALGKLAGRGVAYGSDSVKDFFCEEHGLYITLLSLVPEAMYFQGIPKLFRQTSTFDFPFPEFAEIGEQEVMQEEILGTAEIVDAQEPFGYQERYAEYKRAYNRLAGEFGESMLPWTMAIELSPQGGPESFDINTILMPDDDDVKRVFADNTDNAPQVYATVNFNVKRISTLPYINRTIPMQL